MLFYLLEICWISILIVNGYPSNVEGDQLCHNHGIYLNLNHSPQCYCLPEWEGDLCDYPRQLTNQVQPSLKEITRFNSRNTACTYVPDLCKNNGVCFLDGTSKLACKCPYPYDGPRCQEYSICYNYCFNGCVCKVTDNVDPKLKKAECERKEGFDGDRCQVVVTTTVITTTTETTTMGSTTTDVICSYLPDGYCQNNGFCVIQNNRAICQCPSTHTGDQCQLTTGITQFPGQVTPPINPGLTTRPINPGPINTPQVGIKCTQNPCRNGRPCYNNGNSYYCFCGSQYSGVNCEINQG